jgi:hypothetical protein
MRLFLVSAALLLTMGVSAQTPGAIVTATPSLCLSEYGSYVHTRACTPSVNQFATVYVSPRNAFYIKTTSGGCLSAFEGAGRPVRSVVCNEADANQRWWIHSSGQVQNQANRALCLDIEGGIGRDRRVLNYACDFNGNEAARRDNQRFYLGGTVRYDPGLATRATVTPRLPGTRHVSTGLRGAGIIAPGGGNLIAAGGGNLIAAGGGNLISTGGLN